MTQAIYHLVHNAWCWSPPGSTVTMRIDGAADGSGWTVAIADRGPGIAVDQAKRIFERFAQGGELLISKPSGTGLGLSIAMEVALAHGGRVAYAEREGGGALFTLSVAAEGRAIDTLVAGSQGTDSQAASRQAANPAGG